MTKIRNKIEKLLENKARLLAESTPRIFNLSKPLDRNAVINLISSRKIQYINDGYKEQERELFAVQNPRIVYSPDFQNAFEKHLRKLQTKRPLWQQGRWVYFPWHSKLVHILEDREFQAVRMARNRYLITPQEQEKFYNAAVGIAGLSVGNSVALAIALQGGGRRMRLADHDRLALSNLNRIRAGVESLGLAKTLLTARQIYELNPYAKVEVLAGGLNEKNIKKFFNGPPKLDIVIDELDNLAIKYLIREQARKHRLAVVMAADNGDNGVVDIERYDLNPKTKFFHGRMGKVSYKMLKNLDKFGIGKLITKQVGSENVTERMRQSLLEMGKSIVSWPQLGGAALINGSAVAYCVRKILNKQPLEKNRAIISLDEKLIPNYNSVAQKRKRLKTAAVFKKMYGL